MKILSVTPLNVNEVYGFFQQWMNLGNTWKYFSKYKKAATKDSILYNFVYLKCPE